jgi:HlyD family secretion protein
MSPQSKRRLKWIAALLVLGAVAILAWQRFQRGTGTEGLASGNGRIEATEIDVAAKYAGRVSEILVQEGDFVTAGQVVARMNIDTLEAQLREAQAQERQARSNAANAHSQLAQRQAERAASVAVAAQREAELNLAKIRSQRSSMLAAEGAASRQQADDDRATVQTTAATLAAAHAQVAASDAAVQTARAQIAGAESNIEAARATIERIQADISDSALKAPRNGRVQYRVAQPGEVIAAGGSVLNLVDLTDVYMTFFLPTAHTGKISPGDEVRLMLDAFPRYVIPAKVSFIADVAQFTPKTVETQSEREKLMFRVRAHIPPDLLREHIKQVKTGLPGVAYVRVDRNIPWPEYLKVNVPS